MMKKYISVIALILLGVVAFGGQAPEVVIKAFNLKFPKATNVRWGMENKNEWEAEFKLNGIKLSANFLLNGEWLETEKEIKLADLPEKVSMAIKKQYPGWKVTEADRTETAKLGVIYEADIRLGKNKKEVAYKEDGSPVIE